MWIEGELGKKNREPERRAALEALREKGVNGQLKDSDLVKFRRQTGPMVAGMNPYPLACLAAAASAVVCGGRLYVRHADNLYAYAIAR